MVQTFFMVRSGYLIGLFLQNFADLAQDPVRHIYL